MVVEKNHIVDEKYVLQQLELANQKQSKINKCNTYKALAEIEGNKGAYKLSFSYFQSYKSWSDSVYNEKKQRLLSF